MKHSTLIQQLPEQFFASLVKKVQNELSKGRDIINLGQGNPDLPTPAHIVEAMKVAVTNPSNHKYPPFRGIPPLKEAIAKFYKREYNVTIDPEKEVAILLGGKAGLVQLPLCLVNPGDKILVPDPGYPDYISGISMAKAIPVMMPLLEKNDYLVDYESLSTEELNQSKLMFLNYPNNPTGATATEEFFNKTVEIAKKHEISIIHDFAYGAIGFDGKKPISFLSHPHGKDVGIEIYTLSKTYNMAGWRIGFAVGNAEMIESINLLQDHLHCSVFPAIQDAAIHALLSPQDCVQELVATYESRRNTLIHACNEINWHVQAPKGSFFAWLPAPKGFNSEEFSDYLLTHAGVVVAPGNGFGSYGEGYVRVALLASEEVLQKAVHRIQVLNLFLDTPSSV